jgi:ArsR family transcriptional regulator
MLLKETRQVLKSFADDTRLRIVSLLARQELGVGALCDILDINQSNLSKHLGRLRLTGVVRDRREGMNVYYSLVRPGDPGRKKLVQAILAAVSGSPSVSGDLKNLRGLAGKTKGIRKLPSGGKRQG